MSGTDYRWGTFKKPDVNEIRIELYDQPASQLVVRVESSKDGVLPTSGPGLVAALIEAGLSQGWTPNEKKPHEWHLDGVEELVRSHDLSARGLMTCLVITPFDAGASRLRDTIMRTVRELGVQVLDASDAAGSPSMVASISDWLAEADIVVVDVTRRNPNTYYEIGYAHALGKTTILLVDSARSESLPEALSGNLFLTYDPSNLGALHGRLKKALLRFARMGRVS
ncbi:MAG: hypothetical protein ABW080_02410 [Candidatus Thiodiazotropha sp.]